MLVEKMVKEMSSQSGLQDATQDETAQYLKVVSNRQDDGMGHLLKYENVAWFYEDEGVVKILDRRVFPQKKVFVTCSTYQEVAKAIKEMVTQSGGQFAAATMGMALAAFEFKNMGKDEYVAHMQDALHSFILARPTTKEAMSEMVTPQFERFKHLIACGASTDEIVTALKQGAIEANNLRYYINAKAGENFAKIVKDGQSVLTHCFGETCFAGFLRTFNNEGKKVKIYTQETRPFLQGARLTAVLAHDLGFDTTIVTDGMTASCMSTGKIDYFVTASDVITQDGHVVNKVGTLNTAIVASYYSVPYYAIGILSKKHKTIDDIKVEMRDGKDALYINDTCITEDGIKGFYPSFDITPPSLVSGIATDEGIVRFNMVTVNY